MARIRSRLRDWLFSGPGKHRLLEELFLDPTRSWTRSELARAAGQHPKARIDRVVGPLIQAGVVRRDGNQYSLELEHALVPALQSVLRELRRLPDADLG